MAERKNFSGDRGASFDYLGLGRTLLSALKQSMRLAGLAQSARTVQLQNGVRITVSSVFGQDNISVDAPPELQQEVQAQIKEAERREILLPQSELIEPNTPLTMGVSTSESVRQTDTITLTITTQRIYIGGTCVSGPAYWTSDSGLHALTEKTHWGPNGRFGDVLALSPDGLIAVGSLEIYDSNINPATINPITGGGGQPFGWIARIAAWKTGWYNTGLADVGPWASGDPASRAVGTSTDRSQIWVDVGGQGGRWDGSQWSTIKFSGRAADKPPGPVSADGRVRLSGNKYSLDNGPWITWGDSYSIGNCVVHAPDQVNTLVFSG